MREIKPLPEIAPLDETPPFIAGVVLVRGVSVPVLDLNRRFGHAPQPYRPEDCLILLEQGGVQAALIVDDVRNVRAFTPEERLTLPAYGMELDLDVRFLAGLASVAGYLIRLLDLESVLHLAETLEAHVPAQEGTAPEAIEAGPAVSDPEVQALFHERALRLAEIPAQQERSEGAARVAVRIGEEYFGIDLLAIREFTEVRNIAPIPCCPPHIVGLMNLRGDLITVVDIAGPLGLPPIGAPLGRKALVLERAELAAAVLVDEVLDLFPLPTLEHRLMTGEARQPDREHVLGIVPYRERMVSLLDLPAMLRQNNLTVNESP